MLPGGLLAGQIMRHVPAQLARGLVSQFAIFRQRSKNDILNHRIDRRCTEFSRTPFLCRLPRRHDFARRRRLGVENVIQDIPHVADDFVREFPIRQKLIEDHAEAVDVRAHVDSVGIAFGLFGAAPGKASEKLAIHRDRMIPPHQPVERRVRQTEVKNVRFAALVDANVARFEIAMHDPANVCDVDRRANFQKEPQQSGRIRRIASLARFHVIVQRDSRDVVHGDELCSRRM